MNINVKVGRTAWMTGLALIAAFVVAACGNDSGTVRATVTSTTTVSGMTSVAPTTAPPQEYEIISTPVEEPLEALWAELAGEPIDPTGFVVDVDVEGPLYGPNPTAGDFTAVGHVGAKCIAVFSEGMAGSNESLMTILYIEGNGKMTPWAAHHGSEATVAGANRLIAHFKDQCA